MFLVVLLVVFLSYSSTAYSCKSLPQINRNVVQKNKRIIPQYALSQCDSEVETRHYAHCGYYALWFGICYLRGNDFRHTRRLIFTRGGKKWSINSFLNEWEPFICSMRGKKWSASTPSRYNWLTKGDLKILLFKGLGEELDALIPDFETHTDLVFSFVEKVNEGATVDEELAQLRDIMSIEKVLALLNLLEQSIWNNITIINDLACFESVDRQADFALRIMRLRTKKVPQVILVLIERHWLCFGLRYEGSDIVLSSYNSAGHLDSVTDWHRMCYDLFHTKAPKQWRDVIQELEMNLKNLSIDS